MLVCSDTSGSEEKVDYTVEMARQFLEEQLVLAKEAPRPVRGPNLAQLELIKQLRQRESGIWREIGEYLFMTNIYFYIYIMMLRPLAIVGV